MWWVVRHPATKQTRWAIYLFFCSDRTALHLACLGSGVWRGHTLNKLQTDSSVNASPIVLSLYTIPVGRCVLCAHYLSRDAAKRGDSLSQRAAVGKEMKVRCFFGCHVERGQPAHTEGEEKKKKQVHSLFMPVVVAQICWVMFVQELFVLSHIQRVSTEFVKQL